MSPLTQVLRDNWSTHCSVELTRSLVGPSEAEIRTRFGPPVEVTGPRWQYATANGILVFCASVENGQVVRVRPEDLRLTDVVPNRQLVSSPVPSRSSLRST